MIGKIVKDTKSGLIGEFIACCLIKGVLVKYHYHDWTNWINIDNIQLMG